MGVKAFFALFHFFSRAKLAFNARIFPVFSRALFVFTGTFSVLFTGANRFHGQKIENFHLCIFFSRELFEQTHPVASCLKKKNPVSILRKRSRRRWGPTYTYTNTAILNVFFSTLKANMHCTLSPGTLSRRVWANSCIEAK